MIDHYQLIELELEINAANDSTHTRVLSTAHIDGHEVKSSLDVSVVYLDKLLHGTVSEMTNANWEYLGTMMFGNEGRPEFARRVQGLTPRTGVRLAIYAETSLAAAPWEGAQLAELSRVQLGLIPGLSIVRRSSAAPLHQEPLFRNVRLPRITVIDALGRQTENYTLETALPTDARAKAEWLDGPATVLGIHQETEREQVSDILHFSGHGNGSNQLKILAKLGESAPTGSLSAMALGTFAASGNNRLVVINSCGSGDSSLATTSSIGIAEEIAVTPSVLATIGMRRDVEEGHARLFEDTFYSHLLAGDSVDEAVQESRTALHARGKSAEGAAFSPVLYLRTAGDTRLWREVEELPSAAEIEDAPVLPAARLGRAPLAVRVEDNVWWLDGAETGVRLRNAGRLSEGLIDAPPAEIPGLNRVVSTDGTLVATRLGSQVELRRLVARADNGLDLGSARTFELSPELVDARLLSVRTGSASGSWLFVFSDPARGTLSVTLRGDEWMSASTIESAAVAAVDTPHGVVLGFADGGIARPGSSFGGLSGFATVSDVVSATAAGASIVLVSGAAGDADGSLFRLERRTMSAVEEREVEPANAGSYIVLVRDVAGRSVALVEVDPASKRARVLEN